MTNMVAEVARAIHFAGNDWLSERRTSPDGTVWTWDDVPTDILARAAISAMPTWRTFDTAPRDETPFLAAWKDRGLPSIVWWMPNYNAFGDGGCDSYGTSDQYHASWFTHWMPLPDTPGRPSPDQAEETR